MEHAGGSDPRQPSYRRPRTAAPGKGTPGRPTLSWGIKRGRRPTWSVPIPRCSLSREPDASDCGIGLRVYLYQNLSLYRRVVTPLPAVPGVVKSQFKWTVGTNPAVYSHVFWLYDGLAPTGPQLDTFATAIKTAYDTNLKTMFRANVPLTAVITEDLSTTLTPHGQWLGSVAGTRASGDIPAEVCALLNLRISRRYRGGKPRLYLPAGNSVDAATAMTWSGSFVTAMNAAWTAFHTGVIGLLVGSGHVLDQVSISYFNAGGMRSVPFIDGVLSWSTNPLYSSQRRRMARSS